MNVLWVNNDREKFAFRDFYGKVVTYRPGQAGVLYVAGDFKKEDLPKNARIVKEATLNDSTGFQTAKLSELPFSVHGMGLAFYKCFEYPNMLHHFEHERVANHLLLSTVFSQSTFLNRSLDLVHEPTTGAETRMIELASKLAAAHLKTKCTFNSLELKISKPSDSKLSDLKFSEPAACDKTLDLVNDSPIAFVVQYGDNFCEPISSHGLAVSKNPFVRLVFRLKKRVDKSRVSLESLPGCKELPDEFTVTLLPGMLFIIPSLVNRLYTRQVVHPDYQTTHAMYIFRCSKTLLLSYDDEPRINVGNKRVPLRKGTVQEISQLRKLFAEEDESPDVVYPNIDFTASDRDFDEMEIAADGSRKFCNK